jgi:hypothetical protein
MPGVPDPIGATIQAIQATQAVSIPITQPPIDKQQIGSFYCRVGVTVGTSPTAISIDLPRQPTGFLLFSTSTGAYPYPSSGHTWTPTTIYLQAATSTVVTIFVG